MYITKSLFVNFSTSPHLAWRSLHDKKWVYAQILEAKYWAMDGLAIWEEVEQAVLKLLDTRQITAISTQWLDFSKWHASYHEKTMQALDEKPAVVYQPGFVHNGLFCKCDLLVLNEEWQYDLLEVKAKNSVRKKTKDELLLDDMCADISFQSYVLSRVLGDKFSGKCFFMHLNKEYVREWEIDYAKLIKSDEVTTELMQDAQIELMIEAIRKLSDMTKEQLDQIYPYTWEDHLTYFGTPAEKGSIRNIPRIWRNLPELYNAWIRMIDDITDEQVMNMLTNKKDEPTVQSRYVELRKQWGDTVIDNQAIKEQLSELKYPLYFYDYETVSVPVPVFQNSSPRQQVVVQYSCHKIDADGTITHTEAVIANGENDNTRIIDQLIQDLDNWKDWTYIVRYKWFENSRNKELAEQYPDYKEALEAINAKTFDLMEVFSKLNYFDKRFAWSSSIKKVLPVLTDISYTDLEVSNGAIASDLLGKLSKWTIEKDQEDTVVTDLLEYCKQDTWAMVRIWEEIKKVIT